MYICVCRGITVAQFSETVERHGGCPLAVKCAMGMDESCCGRCDASLPDLILKVSACSTDEWLREERV